MNYWFLILEVVSLLKENPNIGTTYIQDNGKIIRTKDGFTHLVTPNGASSEGVESDKLINAVRRVFSNLINYKMKSPSLLKDFFWLNY